LGVAERRLLVAVVEPPRLTTLKEDVVVVAVVVGQPAELRCHEGVSGTPPLDYGWVHDERDEREEEESGEGVLFNYFKQYFYFT
jgi:hypothetical protein